jgi:hypothetical protein
VNRSRVACVSLAGYISQESRVEKASKNRTLNKDTIIPLS